MNLLRIAFGWSGRIDRTTYLATFGMLTVLGTVFYIVSGAMMMAAPKLFVSLTLLSLPVSGWSSLVLNVKRLRDMGRSPAFAFLPMALWGGALFVALPGLLAAAVTKSGAGVVAALLGGGLLLMLAGIVPFGLLLWMAFAASSPNGSGERLSLFDAAPRDVDAGPRPMLALDDALADALNRRSAQPAYAGAAAAPAGISPVRASGLPQRPGGRVVAPGGGFGRRR